MVECGYDISEKSHKLKIEFSAVDDDEEELFQEAWERLRNGGHVGIEVKQSARTGMVITLSFEKPLPTIPNDASFSRPAIATNTEEEDE